MATARQKVLAYLKKTRTASAREIARALKMSAPNVRHHLGVLASDGRVEMNSLHPRGGRGRPEKLYSLSQAALGDNLDVLSDVLLGEKVDIEAVGQRIAQLHGLGGMTGQPLAKRLVQLVEKLNEMKYQARWEAGAEGPRVILGRCPYSRVVDAHPELCKMDAFILQDSLGKPVEARIKKTGARMPGSCPFLFHID